VSSCLNKTTLTNSDSLNALRKMLANSVVCPPIESEETASTDEMTPRRLRTVASIPGRGNLNVSLSMISNKPFSATHPFSSIWAVKRSIGLKKVHDWRRPERRRRRHQ